MVSFTFMSVIFAAISTGVAALDKGLGTMKTLSVGVVALLGGIVLVYGGMELAAALYQHDTAQVPNALRKMVAGVIMISIGTIVGLFV